jgi:aryl-alcohol dehydrogenase-like predicted oxidoreductase
MPLVVNARGGVDFRTAALQFSLAPDEVAALVVGCSNPQQILADYTSLETVVPRGLLVGSSLRRLDRKRRHRAARRVVAVDMGAPYG